MDDDAGPSGYWLRAASGKLPYGGALACMGLELSSIPAMCLEPERVFSGYGPSLRGGHSFLYLTRPHPPRFLLARMLQLANTS